MTLAYAIPASLRQACPSTRQRSRSNPARPYISRLMTLSRLTWPSTCPLLHGSVRAARTASSSRRRRTAPGRWPPPRERREVGGASGQSYLGARLGLSFKGLTVPRTPTFSPLPRMTIQALEVAHESRSNFPLPQARQYGFR